MDPSPARPTGPALYLAGVQYFFFSCWTVYALYLPGLLESVGIAPARAAWVLMADQILFAVFDVAAGFAADRSRLLYGRIGPWVLGATVVSCLAFLLLPWAGMAGDGGAALLLLLAGLWAITSSALRAPVFSMLCRYAARPQVPALSGIALAGMALAGATAPYLSTLMRGQDPRLPFAVASLALLATASGLIWAERALGKTAPAAQAPAAPKPATLSPGLLFPLAALGALAFQAFFHLDAAPRYLQDAKPEQLPWLMPVFWIGFHVGIFGVGPIATRLGNGWLFALACALGATGAAVSGSLPGLAVAIAGQALAGLGWGAALAAAFGLVSECARARPATPEATFLGILFSMLAVATFMRMGLVALGLPGRPEWTTMLIALPALIWLAVSVTVALRARSAVSETANAR